MLFPKIKSPIRQVTNGAKYFIENGLLNRIHILNQFNNFS